MLGRVQVAIGVIDHLNSVPDPLSGGQKIPYQSAGYLVGKYISIEMVVEKSKGTYYEVLQDSSIDWHENSNDYMPFIKYTLGTIIKAYKDFEERFVLLEKKKKDLAGKSV